MKILIVGGNGTIGKKVSAHFSEENEVLIAARTNGDVTVDIADSNSIEKLFKQIGKLDAIICIAGEAKWADFDSLTEDDFYIGLKSKLMGQVNLVRLGRKYLNPVVKTTSAAMVNGGIHSFVQAAALEMENGIRVNVVSLGMVEDAYEKYKAYFPGHNPIPMPKVVKAYERSVMGSGNGQIIRYYD